VIRFAPGTVRARIALSVPAVALPAGVVAVLAFLLATERAICEIHP
jgi:hypothetical protein